MAQMLTIPNLISLSRIFLVVPIGFALAIETSAGIVWAVALLAIAGITDGLDGYLARRLNKVSRLGIALDPIADKLFAAGVVVLLILFREFPIWLAAIIIGRDLLILLLGVVLLRGRTINLPSNLTGKYAFSAIVVLLVSYIARFQWGIDVFAIISVALIAASLVGYGRVFLIVRKDRPVPIFRDRKGLKVARISITWALSIVYLVKLWYEIRG